MLPPPAHLRLVAPSPPTRGRRPLLSSVPVGKLMQQPDSIGLQTTKVSSRWGCQTQQSVSSSPRGGRNSSALQIKQQRESFQTEEPSVRGQTRRWFCPGRAGAGSAAGQSGQGSCSGPGRAGAERLGSAVSRHHTSSLFGGRQGHFGWPPACPLPQFGFFSPLQGTSQGERPPSCTG